MEMEKADFRIVENLNETVMYVQKHNDFPSESSLLYLENQKLDYTLRIKLSVLTWLTIC